MPRLSKRQLAVCAALSATIVVFSSAAHATPSTSAFAKIGNFLKWLVRAPLEVSDKRDEHEPLEATKGPEPKESINQILRGQIPGKAALTPVDPASLTPPPSTPSNSMDVSEKELRWLTEPNNRSISPQSNSSTGVRRSDSPPVNSDAKQTETRNAAERSK